MRSWINACLCIILTLFVAEGKAQTIWVGPNGYLRGIDAIRYNTYFDNQSTGHRCGIDENNWTIALKFVVNQSTKLKFIPDQEFHKRGHELQGRLYSLAKDFAEQGTKTSSETAYFAARKELEEHYSIPELHITVTPIELESGCAGTLVGELKVRVEPTHIIATKAELIVPTVVIWNDGHTLKGRHQSFSGFMISSGEQLIKKLVNDWTEAQIKYSTNQP